MECATFAATSHSGNLASLPGSDAPVTLIMPLLHKPLVDGIRAIAIHEAAKGALVLLAGFGLLGLLHRDVEALAERLVTFSHLNPASKYPRIFLDAATRVTDTQLWWLAGEIGRASCRERV